MTREIFRVFSGMGCPNGIFCFECFDSRVCLFGFYVSRFRIHTCIALANSLVLLCIFRVHALQFVLFSLEIFIRVTNKISVIRTDLVFDNNFRISCCKIPEDQKGSRG